MTESKFLDLGDVRLHYVEAPGPKPILILLHGFTDSVTSYLPLLPLCATSFHVYAVDFRGHGQSSHTPNQYTLRNHVHDIERFMDHISNGPVCIAGHSMGGWIVAWLAALHPDIVQAIIIEDVLLDIPPAQAFAGFIARRDQLMAFKASGKTAQDLAMTVADEPIPGDSSKTRLDVYGLDGVTRHANQWWAMDITHFDNLIEGTLTADWNEQDILPKIQCPTLFLTDNAWTDDEVQHNLASVRKSKQAIINVRNHRVHEMRPQEYWRVVEGFLQPFMTH